MLAYFDTNLGSGELLKRTVKETQADNGLGLAAQLAYYFFLALFPTLLFLIALAGVFASEGLVTRVVEMLGRAAPPDVISIIRDQLISLSQGNQGGIMTFGVVAALWSSSAAMVALTSYTLLIITRNMVEGLDAVPTAVLDAADGMGMSRTQRLLRVELPLAAPTILTGIRVATVTIVGLVGISVVIQLGGFAVLIFDVLLNVTSLFNHGNVRIPTPWDRVLRWFVVTPDMHRVHQSVRAEETNSNFGFTLPWWDRMLGTYHAQPEAGHRDMTIGLEQFRTVADLRLDRMLLQPVSRPAEVPPSAGARSVT